MDLMIQFGIRILLRLNEKGTNFRTGSKRLSQLLQGCEIRHGESDTGSKRNLKNARERICNGFKCTKLILDGVIVF